MKKLNLDGMHSNITQSIQSVTAEMKQTQDKLNISQSMREQLRSSQIKLFDDIWDETNKQFVDGIDSSGMGDGPINPQR